MNAATYDVGGGEAGNGERAGECTRVPLLLLLDSWDDDDDSGRDRRERTFEGGGGEEREWHGRVPEKAMPSFPCPLFFHAALFAVPSIQPGPVAVATAAF